MHPKVYWRATAENGAPLGIKIEINTHERSPALSPIRHHYRVDSSWWTGSAEVLTFQPAELVATKIRALYQRSKGRDLFDLWLALDHLRLARPRRHPRRVRPLPPRRPHHAACSSQPGPQTHRSHLPSRPRPAHHHQAREL